MSDLRDRYLACWNADDAARPELVADVFATDARYVDPLADARGLDAIAAVIAGARSQFPGLVFGAVGSVDDHHDAVRFSWGLGPAGGEPLVIGSDTVLVGADGLVTSVVGFIDRMPAA